jgi:putative thiamine transport system ATP-binding protein
MSLKISVDYLASPQRVLIRELHLLVAPGTVHTVMGPSGCGKSSLLSAVCGTLAADMAFAGSITLGGRRIDGLATQQRGVGILFQDALLFAHMTVRENLLFALRAGDRRLRDAAVAQALRDVELPDVADADPATLSGGQRARIALARALLARPAALLLDEPYSRLDAALRERMRTLVLAMVRERNIPALLVSHDAADVADASALTVLAAPMGADSGE